MKTSGCFISLYIKSYFWHNVLERAMKIYNENKVYVKIGIMYSRLSPQDRIEKIYFLPNFPTFMYQIFYFSNSEEVIHFCALYIQRHSIIKHIHVRVDCRLWKVVLWWLPAWSCDYICVRKWYVCDKADVSLYGKGFLLLLFIVIFSLTESIQWI